MFGVNVDVVPVDTVRLRELGGVLDELLHFHGWLVFTQFFKGPHWYVRRGDTVYRSRDSVKQHHRRGLHLSRDRVKI